MPLSSYEVLLFLNDSAEGRMRMSELADSVLLSRSGLTRLVDRLERQGLLRRALRERRARLVRRDHAGGPAVFAVARKTHLDGVRRLFLSRFSRDELRTLGGIWQKQSRSARYDIGAATACRERRAARGSRGQPPHALVELGRVEQREREPEGRLRTALGRERVAGDDRHAVARRLGVERAVVERASVTQM